VADDPVIPTDSQATLIASLEVALEAARAQQARLRSSLTTVSGFLTSEPYG
jgi:hypothetical protein